jgi:hypothetical protein
MNFLSRHGHQARRVINFLAIMPVVESPVKTAGNFNFSSRLALRNATAADQGVMGSV